MNILIPNSWLREHLKTKASPKQIAEYLSLCSQSVERTTQSEKDWIYEIEITTNRPDCLSVYGIGRELKAILPRFGIKTQLREIKETKINIPKVKKPLPLEVKINNHLLCPRFTALIFDKITIKPSPKIIQARLEKSGIRALNNVVDISNYLMLELGQPMHTFDYDKIKGAEMTLRESAGGGKITTLDGQIRPLPDGAIIIEDGESRIIDLCGIMGGENSAVDEKTTRILLFIQTYDPVKIRLACQQLAFRTEAAQRFEKGIDPEGVILAMKKAIVMFAENCGARVASELIDIYPNPPKTKKITLTQDKLDKLLGIHLELTKAKEILENLGFLINLDAAHQAFAAIVPHWRNNDVSIPEDLVEEIARIYGYHKIPSRLPQGSIPIQLKDPLFDWENRVKDALKFWGFTETVSYSMVSLEALKKINFDPKDCLKITNPLTEDLVYLRPSLIASLLAVIAKNQAEFGQMHVFELANTYIPTANGKLPAEIPMLTGTITGSPFFQAKGIVETLLEELGINDYQIVPYQLKKTFYGKVFHPFRTAEVMVEKDSLGVVGEISPKILSRFGVKGRVAAFDLDFSQLAKYATTFKKYLPIPKYPAIIEDLSFVVLPKTLVGEMLQLIKAVSPIIQSVELIDSYQTTRTFRIIYQSQKKTLTEKVVEKIRGMIVKKIKEKFRAKLRQQD